jgi:hypothetical protein
MRMLLLLLMSSSSVMLRLDKFLIFHFLRFVSTSFLPLLFQQSRLQHFLNFTDAFPRLNLKNVKESKFKFKLDKVFGLVLCWLLDLFCPECKLKLYLLNKVSFFLIKILEKFSLI